jgi:site-specific recombinase XerD
LTATRVLFQQAIGDRKAGFVFLHEEFDGGRSKLPLTFPTPHAFRSHLQKIVADMVQVRPNASEREQRRAVVAFARSLGQIPEKRVRDEFMKLTEQIGFPEFTRAHNLRHLFSSRAQAAGVNPIVVQEMLGHATLDMTRRYTHLGLDTKRAALHRIASPTPQEIGSN